MKQLSVGYACGPWCEAGARLLMSPAELPDRSVSPVVNKLAIAAGVYVAASFTSDPACAAVKPTLRDGVFSWVRVPWHGRTGVTLAHQRGRFSMFIRCLKQLIICAGFPVGTLKITAIIDEQGREVNPFARFSQL